MQARLWTSQVDLSGDRGLALELIPVSRETADRLDILVECLLRALERTNLIAASTIPHIWTRHIADSLQLLNLAPDGRVWVDLGSGAGFPGLVLACALAERAGAVVHLVESIQKKCAFLREAIAATGASAVVHCERIEDFTKSFAGRPDVITARALAPMRILLGYVHPLLKSGAQALLLKGQDVGSELTEAAKYWNIRFDLVASKTSASGKIVIIRGVESRKGGRRVAPAS
jgi:16S rRNA (guanine527-N7)-methyltransferase